MLKYFLGRDFVKINDIYEVNIIDDNHNGCGIAKINGIPRFIFGTLLRDKVKIRITYVNKKYAIGEVLSYIKCTSHEEVKCPYYGICGGCDLLHVSFDKENKLKRKYISKLFNGFDINISFHNRFGYRNKIVLHVKDGKTCFYKKESNDIVNIKRCLLVSDKMNELIDSLNELNLCFVTEIVIKEGIDGILLSIYGKISSGDLESIISNKYVKSTYQNDTLIYGDLYITQSFNNIKYLVNNNSFFQVNNECALDLYEYIKRLVGNTNDLLDLYCGTGSIGIYLSDVCKSVLGVERNSDSVLCARENMKINNINNYEIILGDASEISKKFDVIVVDPPREGLSKTVINNLNNMKAQKIIYVSCNPSTLKRDILLLDNYNLQSIRAFNMFPATKHIECVVLLERKD